MTIKTSITAVASILASLAFATTAIAQEKREAPRPRQHSMSLDAKMTPGHVAVHVDGAPEQGLIVVLYGQAPRSVEVLINGTLLELEPLGVLAWGETFNGSLDTSVEYDPRFTAGIEFRLQAFAINLESLNVMEMESSPSIVRRVPEDADLAAGWPISSDQTERLDR